MARRAVAQRDNFMRIRKTWDSTRIRIASITGYGVAAFASLASTAKCAWARKLSTRSRWTIN